MADNVGVTPETIKQLTLDAERGKRFLERLELSEAEEVFRDILQQVPTYRDVQTDTVIVSALFGLAEIHAKHCRSLKDKEMEWMCGMMFSLLFYRAASEVCGKVMRHRRPQCDQPRQSSSGSSSANRPGSGSGNRSGNGDYFSDTMSRSKNHSNTIEVCLLGALKGKVLEWETPYLHLRKNVDVDDVWLENLWEFCSRSAADYHSEAEMEKTGGDDTGGDLKTQPTRRRFSLISQNRIILPSHEAAVTSVNGARERRSEERTSSPGSTVVSAEEKQAKRRINFDRFQDAIKQFVSEVSTDIRNKYMHISGKIPHGLLDQRICSELALHLSSEYDDTQELQNIYESLRSGNDRLSCIDESEESLETTDTIVEESSDEWEEEEDEDVETVELYIKPSATHSSRTEVKKSSDVSSSVIVPFESKQSTSGSALALLNNTTSGVGKEVNGNRWRRPEDGGKVGGDGRANQNNSNHVEVDKVDKVEETQRPGGNSGVLTRWRGRENGKTPAIQFYDTWSKFGGFEKVSQFTEKKERTWSLSKSEAGLHRYINEAKLSQLLGSMAIKLADVFKKESKYLEACQLYKYAFGIFKGYPLAGGQNRTLAKLLVDIGSTCCNVGELESGSRLIREAAALYESSGEVLMVADVWYQMGNVLLSDNLRQESLLARVMQMVRDEEMRKEDEPEEPVAAAAADNDEVSDSSSDTAEDNTYCSCIHEAIDCYKYALELLDGACNKHDPDLRANILSNIGDCYLMTDNLDRAERCYEEALTLFSSTSGTVLLQKNAHALCLMGMLNFLTTNYVRAATMYETSHVLRQHLPDAEDPTLEMAWSLTMLGLSYHSLGHYHQSVTWCIRAFKLYTRFFRGRLLSVDVLSRWFVVQNLYILGFGYISLRLYKKAIHYLNFCKNMISEAEDDQCADQSIRVLLALGDAYSGAEDDENAAKLYAEAEKRIPLLKDDSRASMFLINEVHIRLIGGNKHQLALPPPPLSFSSTPDGPFHDQAVLEQRFVEASIMDEMIAMLLKLGLTSVKETDIDWAIGCYDKCVQGYRNLHESSEAARALASLGTLCHVKGRMQEDGSKEKVHFLKKAEDYFREAHAMVDSSSPVTVQFGNYLFREENYPEALQVMLPFIFCRRPEDVEISYSGIEQMVLPVHLHQNIEEEETLVLEARIFAKFLGVLCFQHLRMKKDVADAIVELYKAVVGSSRPLNYTLLGYALLEVHLYLEAAESFAWSSRMQPESDLSYSNTWICYLLAAYATLARGLENFLQVALRTGRNDREMLTFHEKKRYLRRQAACRARKLMQATKTDVTVNCDVAGGRSLPPNMTYQRQISGETSFKGVPMNHQKPNICQDETGPRKKWRSKLYHNLPESQDSELFGVRSQET